MSENTLMYVLGLLGALVLVFGIWLLRAGKSIEKDISQGPVTPKVQVFNNWGPNYIWELWGPNNTRPLAYLSVVVGVILLLLFAMSL